MRRKLPEHSDCRRLVVHEDAAFAASCDLAPQDELLFCAIDAVGFQQRSDGLRLGVEDRRHHSLVSAMSNRVGGSFIAQQESQRVNQDGFAGPSFAGEQVKAGGELDGNVVNDRVVFDPQFQQHVSSLAEVKRSVARGNRTPSAPPT